MLRKKFSEVVVFMVVYHGIESVKTSPRKQIQHLFERHLYRNIYFPKTRLGHHFLTSIPPKKKTLKIFIFADSFFINHPNLRGVGTPKHGGNDDQNPSPTGISVHTRGRGGCVLGIVASVSMGRVSYKFWTQKLLVWVDVSPCPFGGYSQVQNASFGKCI